jgi:hypothetical protein
MQLTKTTLSLLQNFAAINPNLLLQAGSTIKTISEAKTILGQATVSEVFPREVAIYDLNEFLSIYSLIEDGDLVFGENSVTVTNGSNSVEYFYASPELITTATRDVKLPLCEVKLVLTNAILAKVKKAASVLGHSHLIVSGNNGVITLQIADQNNVTANKYSVTIDEDNECREQFKFVFLISNLKMLSGDYNVSLSSKLISHFVNSNAAVEYWVALERSSTFGE